MAAVASPRAGSAAGVALAALHVPEGPLQFHGLIPYPPVAVTSAAATAALLSAGGGAPPSRGGTPPVDDWGLTLEQQVTAVERFRALLDSRGQWSREHHDYYTLLRFLRARNYDLDKAGAMWRDTLEWRASLGADTMLNPASRGGFVFHEREQFLMAYPQGYHKTDKMGRPVYIQLLGRIDPAALRAVTTEDRMVKFHIQEYERCAKVIFPVCSWLGRRQIDQTFGIMDVKGVGLSHLTGEVKRLISVLTKYDQDNYPEMLGRIVIINAPMVFKAVWSLIKPYLNPRTISKIAICGSDYLPELLTYVDADSLPEWLGGRSKGTLLDDAGPWSDPAVLRRIEQESSAAAAAGKLSPVALAQLRRALRLAGLPPLQESIPAAPLLPHVGGGGAPAVAAITSSSGGGGAGGAHGHGASAAGAAAGAAAATGAAVVRLSSPDEPHGHHHHHGHHHGHHGHHQNHASPLSLGGGGATTGPAPLAAAASFGGPGSETEGGYATPRSDLSLFSPSPSVSASSAGGVGAANAVPAPHLDAALLRLREAGGGAGANSLNDRDTATSALRGAGEGGGGYSSAVGSPRATSESVAFGAGAAGAAAAATAATAAAAAAATPSPSPSLPVASAPQPQPRGFAAPPGASASRMRGLLERLAVLERQYGGQVQRLKGYLPAAPPATAALLQEAGLAPAGVAGAGASAVAAASAASGGPTGGSEGPATTLQRRVEALEAAMDLLLRAQELSWQDGQQQQQQQRRRRRRAGCLSAPEADTAGAATGGGASAAAPPPPPSSACSIM